MLSVRVATAIVGVPVLFGVALLGGPVYGVVLVLATMIAAWEMRTMLRNAGHHPSDSVLLGLATALPLDAWFFVDRQEGVPLFREDGMLILALSVLGSLIITLLRNRMEGALVDWALSLACAFYLGGLMQFFAPLRDRPSGAFWVIAAVGLSFVCDSVAFFLGRALGRTRLAPRISPTKSREGALAGLLAAALVGALAAPWVGQPALLLAGYGLVVGAATILGDLAESLVKRQVGAKDSGGLVPGHGGILDRMDSLLFCAPVAVLYLRVFT